MANELNSIMPEILAVMKDMASLLEKQDTTQEKAKLDKPPKTGEDQKPITGGTAPGFKPGEGIAKEFPTLGNTTSAGNQSTSVDSGGATLLKEDEQTEEDEAEAYAGEETPEEEAAEEESGDVAELKSLLKSIVTELRSMQKSQTFSKADMRKAVQDEADKMLRKMGFHPTRPDVVKLGEGTTLGVDQTSDIKKSEDQPADIKKSKVSDINGKDLSSLSWRELGSMRESMGGFDPFIGK